MCVDRSVAGSASKVLVLAVGDVLVCASIAVFLGKAKVDDVDQVAFLTQPHQKVVWLHVSVDEILGVDVFNTADLEGRARGNLMSVLTVPRSTVVRHIQSLSLKLSSSNG